MKITYKSNIIVSVVFIVLFGLISIAGAQEVIQTGPEYDKYTWIEGFGTKCEYTAKTTQSWQAYLNNQGVEKDAGAGGYVGQYGLVDYAGDNLCWGSIYNWGFEYQAHFNLSSFDLNAYGRTELSIQFFRPNFWTLWPDPNIKNAPHMQLPFNLLISGVGTGEIGKDVIEGTIRLPITVSSEQIDVGITTDKFKAVNPVPPEPPSGDTTYDEAVWVTTSILLYPKENQPPVAAFEVSSTSGPAPLKVIFTDTSTGDGITSREWQYKLNSDSTWTSFTLDGESSFTFTNAGTYDIKLTVTGTGGSDDEIKTNIITSVSAPVSAFEVSPTSGPAPLKVIFTDTSTGDGITSREWQYKLNSDSMWTTFTLDGISSFTFTNAGTYDIKLTVTGTGGSDDEIKTNIITSEFSAPEIQILDARMVSPNELGIGAIVKYPASCPDDATTTFTITGAVDGHIIAKSISVPKSGNPGGEWGRMVSVDINGKMLPTTPLRINLADQGVPRFTDSVNFTLTVTASYDGSAISEPVPYSGKILLPVVVLHGYVTEVDRLLVPFPGIPKIEMLGYPGGDTAAPSSTPQGDVAIYRGIFYNGAYKGLSEYLVSKNYTKLKTNDFSYVTLWDPSDPEIGYSSLSFATPADLSKDFDRVYAKVKQWSYADSFNIIGHSTGGLTARYWASQQNGIIKKIFTVGTPNEGITRFYEEVYGGKYASRQDFELNRLKTQPGGSIENTLAWFVPRWNATDLSKINRDDPSTRFSNTFTYGYSPNVNFYVISGLYKDNGKSGSTPYRVSLISKEDWYTLWKTLKSKGDEYVYADSAAARKFGPADSEIFHRWEVPVTKSHATILLNPNIQNYIANVLTNN